MIKGLKRFPAAPPLLAALLLLGGCASIDVDLDLGIGLYGPADEEAASPEAARPTEMAAEMVAEPVPPPPPVIVYSLDQTLPMAEMWAAERIATRFVTLHRLANDGLIEPTRFAQWAELNQGAFLLFTANPPLTGLGTKIPPYDEVADYLRDIRQHRPEIAKVERAALLDRLMPMEGPRAAAQRPPKTDMLPRWLALLDRLAAEGALPAERIAAEKTALRQVFGDELVMAVPSAHQQ